jgi:hypothetical protein
VARVTSGNSTYFWNYANSAALNVQATGWALSGTIGDYNPLDTPPWTIAYGGSPNILEINATPVPEPTEYASVAGIAGLLAAGWMRRRRKA